MFDWWHTAATAGRVASRQQPASEDPKARWSGTLGSTRRTATSVLASLPAKAFIDGVCSRQSCEMKRATPARLGNPTAVRSRLESDGASAAIETSSA
jgi:hypothetical protein